MCECYNAKCVFYWYDELTEEDYKVDKETLLNYVEKVIDRRKATTYRRQGFNRGGVDVDLYDEYSRKQDEIYERKTRYKEAVEQIKLTIQTGDRLMLCTNGKLRRAYARELAKDYSKKYDCTILIGDIEVLVEEEYRRRK